MGCDLMNFIYENNRSSNQLQCYICEMHLENPLQSRFCYKCVNEWCNCNNQCHQFLKFGQLQDQRNMDELARSRLHTAPFESNQQLGCHSRQELTTSELTDTLIQFYRRQQEELAELNNALNLLQAESTEYNDEVNCFSTPLEGVGNVTSYDHEENASSTDELNMSTITSLDWQVCDGMKVVECKATFLEVEKGAIWALAQSSVSLEPTRCFAIRIINIGGDFHDITIGLTSKGLPYKPGKQNGSIGYYSSGRLLVNGEYHNVGREWMVGDVIECGIKYHFMNNECNYADIYFCINDEIIYEELTHMPKNELFPTICMEGTSVQLEYLKK